MDSVFKGKNLYVDFSYDLRDKRDWKVSTIRDVEYLNDVSAFAVEPTNGLIAIGRSTNMFLLASTCSSFWPELEGTKHGKILVFGASPVVTILRVSRNVSVKFLQFAVLVFKLICIGMSQSVTVHHL